MSAEDLSFRVLSGPDDLPRTLTAESLARAYAWPATPSVRANFIATLDGAVTGTDGRSGSLGTRADNTVFHLLRATCDAIVVGAGTARAEDYGPPPPGTLLVVVSRRAALPARLLNSPDVVLATAAGSGSELDRIRRVLGDERVWVLGASEVDAAGLRDRLIRHGRSRILHEGGPALATQWFQGGCIDELCLTTVGRLGLGGPRLVQDGGPGIGLRPRMLLQESDTLFSRWAVIRPEAS